MLLVLIYQSDSSCPSSFIEENSSYVAQEPETMSIVPEDDRG